MLESYPLIRYLPRSLSADPDLRPALRLQASAAIGYRLRDDRLTLTLDGRAQTFDLVGPTLLELADGLRAAGLRLQWSDPDLIALGAVILADTHGHLAAGEQVELAARTSLIYVLARPVEAEYRRLRTATADAAEQVSMATADGAWLDRHGTLYGIARPAGLDDDTYRRLLLAEILRPRNNARGIELTLRRLLGRDIRVLEPWQDTARWDLSAASGGHPFQDGQRWGHNLLQVSGADPDDLAAATAIVERDRAAGCLLLAPSWRPLARLAIHAGIGTRASLSRHRLHGLIGAPSAWPPIWSVSRASDYEVTPTYGLTRIRSTSQAFGLGLTAPRLDQAWRFCRGAATWSEDSRLGDLNTRFAGGWFFEAPGAARRLDDDAVWSDGDAQARRVDICVWTESSRTLDAAPVLAEAGRAGLMRGSQRGFFAAARVGVGSYRWDAGRWDARTWTFAAAFLRRATPLTLRAAPDAPPVS